MSAMLGENKVGKGYNGYNTSAPAVSTNAKSLFSVTEPSFPHDTYPSTFPLTTNSFSPKSLINLPGSFIPDLSMKWRPHSATEGYHPLEEENTRRRETREIDPYLTAPYNDPSFTTNTSPSLATDPLNPTGKDVNINDTSAFNAEAQSLDYLLTDTKFAESKRIWLQGDYEFEILLKLMTHLHSTPIIFINHHYIRNILKTYFDSSYLKKLTENHRKIILKSIFIAVIIRFLIISSLKGENEKSLKESQKELFLEKYPEFENVESKWELLALIRYDRALTIALQYLQGRGNKQLLLSVSAHLEGSNMQYVTGGQPSPGTRRRILVFERVSGIKPMKRAPRGSITTPDGLIIPSNSPMAVSLKKEKGNKKGRPRKNQQHDSSDQLYQGVGGGVGSEEGEIGRMEEEGYDDDDDSGGPDDYDASPLSKAMVRRSISGHSYGPSDYHVSSSSAVYNNNGGEDYPSHHTMEYPPSTIDFPGNYHHSFHQQQLSPPLSHPHHQIVYPPSFPSHRHHQPATVDSSPNETTATAAGLGGTTVLGGGDDSNGSDTFGNLDLLSRIASAQFEELRE
jgi:hypothetical protein